MADLAGAIVRQARRVLAEGHFEWPNGKDGDPAWVQPHDELLKDALHSWKGWPSDMRIHMRDEQQGAKQPGSGSGKQMRAQAKALLEELARAPMNPRKLYRGDHRQPSGVQAFTESKVEARRWAKKGGGQVYVLAPGSARALRIADHLYSQLDQIEKEWIVDLGGAMAVVASVDGAKEVLLWRGIADRGGEMDWDGRPYTAQSLLAEIVDERGGFGVWWGSEDEARFYGKAEGGPYPSGGGRSPNVGVLVSAWFPAGVTSEIAGHDDLVIKPGTKGRIASVEVYTDSGWKALPAAGMTVTA